MKYPCSVDEFLLTLKSTMAEIDPRSGFCKSNSTFYSKRKPVPLPANDSLDVTTFISSCTHHGKIAFIDAATGDSITYSDLWCYVESVADTLSADFGIRKGDVILLFTPNSIYFPIVCLAVMSLGAIITTTNPLNTAGEIAKQIADSKPVLAFTIPQLLPKIADSNLPIVLLTSNFTNDLISNKRKILMSIKEMMGREPRQSRVRERVKLDDTATLLYSSGTTGTSKGVVSSHRNLIAIVQTTVDRFKSDQGHQTFLCTVPMFHIFGLSAFAISSAATGSTVVVMSRFEMDEMLMVIQKYSVTHLPLVPPILVALINNTDAVRRKYDLRSLRSVICGGAPLSKEATEGFVERYPKVAIMQGYGLTESTGSGTSTDSLEESRKYGTAGLLSPSIDGKIMDLETGVAMPVNQTGELWLRGPCIMKGMIW